MSQTRTAPRPSDAAPPYLWAALAGLAVLLLYVLTLARTTAFWDASEYIATTSVMGIPHPPGNPLFVVLARAWTVLLEPTGLSVAVRVNLFSATMGALAHGLWFLVVHHVLRRFSTDRVFRLGGAAAAVLVAATAFTVWSQSNVNEKVYTVALATIALVSWLVLRWQDRLERGGDHNPLVLVAFVLALSVGNHLMAFLAAPAVGLYVLRVRPKVLFAWRLYPALAGAALLGLSIHLVLPVRAGLDPVINQTAPECAELGEALVSVATYGRAGCEALNAALTREHFKAPGMPGPGLVGPRQAPVTAQAAHYLQYFDWQWGRGIQGEDTLFPPFRVLVTMLFVALGMWGAMEHRRHDRTSFWYVAALFGTLSAALAWYMNFELGSSMTEPAGGPWTREVRERDYFFIASFSVWGLWAGVGLAAIWRSLAGRTGSLLRAAPVLGVALLPLVLNLPRADRAHDTAARDWAYNLLMSVEPYAVLFTSGDNDTFPLWYLQEAEGIRRDVQVIVGTYLRTEWYPQQIRELTAPCDPGVNPLGDPSRIICQRPYEPLPEVRYGTGEPEVAEQVVLDTVVRQPARSALGLDDATIAGATRSVLPIEEDRALRLGPVTTRLRAGTVLTPEHQLAAAIIVSSLGDRPVYFSSNASTIATTLGLSDRLVRQGLAHRLLETDPTDVPGLEPMPRGSPLASATGAFVDTVRTERLLDEVFIHRNGIPEWDFWPDRSVSVPFFYAWAYLAVAQAAYQQGDDPAMERYQAAAERWGMLGS